MPSDIDTADATITDGGSNRQPLVNGVLLQEGAILVENVSSTADVPLAAWIISEDESGVYAGQAECTGGAAGAFKWQFSWKAVPELGCNATLRIKETVGDGAGAVVNFTVHVVANPTTHRPCTE